MRSRLLHQDYEFFIKAGPAHAIGELQMDIQLALDNTAADLLGALQFEVEDIIHDHELAESEFSPQPFHLVENHLRFHPAKLLAVNLVAIRALIRTAPAGDELTRSLRF